MKNPTYILILLIGLTVPASALGPGKKTQKAPSSGQTAVLNARHVSGASQSAANLASGKAPVKKFSLGAFPGAIVPPAKPLAKRARSRGNLRVTRSRSDGLPRFIRVRDRGSSPLAKTGAAADSREASYRFLEELSPLLGAGIVRDAFQVKQVRPDHGNTTQVRLVQRHRGVDIYGSEVILHLDNAGRGVSFNGRYRKVSLETEPSWTITQDRALLIVMGDLRHKTVVRPLRSAEKALMGDAAPMVNEVMYPPKETDNALIPAYEIHVRPNFQEEWRYIIHGHTGDVIRSWRTGCRADGPATAQAQDLNGVMRTIRTYQSGNEYVLMDGSRAMFDSATGEGAIFTADARASSTDDLEVWYITSSDNTWNNPRAVSAHFNAGTAYRYFLNAHGRNSIDGDGGTIYSFINVADEFGEEMDNAFWNGKAIFYGNGKDAFTPLAASLDVAGHEMTHGVVENTASLEYWGESGAINESMADIFGCMMDSADWRIGEDIVVPAYFPSGALRDLSDPHNGGADLNDNGWQPAHVSEQYMGQEDNAGVHTNSGIPNHAFYLLAQDISRQKAAAIFYKALEDYLTRSSRFTDLRLAAVQAAEDLYGAGTPEVIAAAAAFDAVGITEAPSTAETVTFELNPGTPYLLSYDTNPLNTNSLYISSVSGTDFVPISQTGVNNRPSITDGGTEIVFVSSGNQIMLIDISDPAAVWESVLQEELVWDNAAISKDGQRVAAVTDVEDTSIFVYDFVSEEWSQFRLYNPTFTAGVTTSGPVWADAIEWDFTGEYLIYDAMNRISAGNGDDIEYYDVGVIRVWDNGAGTFGDGAIEKLFSNLPENVSLGNPTFSKNSPNIIAFDYIDWVEDTYAIMSCDIETFTVTTVYPNWSVGWPSFNRKDTRIAFNTLDVNDDQAIGYIGLKADKLTPSGDAALLVPEAGWPVYFTVGERNISETRRPFPAPVPSEFRAWPSPAGPVLNVSVPFRDLKTWGWFLYSTDGKEVLSDRRASGAGAEIAVGGLETGVYMLEVRGGKKRRTLQIFKK